MRRRLAAGAAAAALLLAAGCGGDDGGARGSGSTPAPRGPEDARLRAQLAKATAVRPADFPSTQGRTMQQLADTITSTGPQLAPATSVLTPGTEQRLAFGLLDQGTRFLYAPTVVYVARSGGTAKVRGPFPAPADLLITDAPFRSETAAAEDSPFAAVYAAGVTFDAPGTYDVLAVSKIEGRDVAAGSQVKVVSKAADRIPEVGERPPAVETDTLASAGGDEKAIDTRRPPGTMHDVSFKDVVGKKPTVLLFATPQLCQSRVCGPVVDIAEQLKRSYGDRVQFIHQEVYVGNKVENGLRPPLKAFGLQTEPWLFAVDRRGRITARLEGSFGFDAMKRAIESALG